MKMLKLVFGCMTTGTFVLGATMFVIGVMAFKPAVDINTGDVRDLLVSITTSSFHVGIIFFFLIILFTLSGLALLMAVGYCACGCCCKSVVNPYNRYGFIVLVLSVVTGLIFAASLIVKIVVESKIQERMGESFKDNYVGDTLTSSNSISNAWNYMFMTIDCCGVNSVQSKTNDFDTTPWCTYSGTCQEGNSEIPKTCCLSVDEDTYLLAPNDCYASVTSGTYNTKGCYDALEDKVFKETTTISIVTGFSTVCAIINGVLAIKIHRKAINMKTSTEPNHEAGSQRDIDD